MKIKIPLPQENQEQQDNTDNNKKVIGKGLKIPKLSVKDFIKSSIAILKQDRQKVIIQIAAALILSTILGGLLQQTWNHLFHPKIPIQFSPVYIVAYAFTSPGIFLTLFLFLIMNAAFLFIRILFKKEYKMDNRNYRISETGTYGTSGKMTEETQNKLLNKSDVKHTLGNILGKTENEDIVSMKPQRGMNPHKIVFGASSSRKTRSIVIPDILQSIRRGESTIVVDPKGELYRDTSKLAEKYGYKTRILNLKPEEMECSDAVDFMKPLKENPSKATLLTQTLVEVIMKNTSSIKEGNDFFSKVERNFLSAMILFVALNPSLTEEEKTLGEVYNLMQKGMGKIDALFASLPPNHPAMKPYIFYSNASDSVKQSAYQGTGVRLQVFQDDTVKNVVSNDEIDLKAPGFEKCIYYIVISDQEATMKFIASLFFSMSFIQLVGAADKIKRECDENGKVIREEGRLPVTVNFLIEEAANVGAIPDFEKKEATVRSRGIHITSIYQNIGQIQDNYPGNVWNTIISNCATQIVLSSNDPNTSEFFSNRSGIQTVLQRSMKYNSSSFDMMKLHPVWDENSGEGKRNVYNPDEITQLDPDHELVFLQGNRVIELIKFDYSEHFLAKEMEPQYANEHIPEWRKKILDKTPSKEETTGYETSSSMLDSDSIETSKQQRSYERNRKQDAVKIAKMDSLFGK